MGYTKTTWETGDIITAAKLNNMENGIEGATPLIAGVTTEDQDKTLDKTWQEIHDALAAGIPVYTKLTQEGAGTMLMPVAAAIDQSGTLIVIAMIAEVSSVGIETYTALTANSYPTTGTPK